jgi:hypothetical protein
MTTTTEAELIHKITSVLREAGLYKLNPLDPS